MAAAALGLAAFGQAQVDPNRVVATVNGEAIKGAEYYHRMEYLPGVRKAYGGQAIETPPGFMTVVELIGEHLLFQLAKEKGVLPNKQEVDNELQLRISQDPQYITKWAATGRSQDDLEAQVKYELAKFKLQTLGITITDQEIQKYYKDNPKFFTSEKLLKLRMIAVPASLTDDVDKDLKAGKDFAAVAKTRSVDVTKAAGGEVGLVPATYLPPAVGPAVSALKIGQTTSWLELNGKKAKYQLADVLPEKLQPLDKTMIISTRRILMLERGKDKNNLPKMLDDMRAKSKIVISQKEFAAMYDRLTGVDTGGGD